MRDLPLEQPKVETCPADLVADSSDRSRILAFARLLSQYVDMAERQRRSVRVGTSGMPVARAPVIPAKSRVIARGSPHRFAIA
jgi:hypothetical protein